MVHAVGIKSAMVRSLCELGWREDKERRGEERRGGSLNEEACERPCPKRRKRRGEGEVRHGDEGEDQEPTGCQ